MLEISSRATAGDEPYTSLELPFDLRQKSRFRATLGNGEEVSVALPRGEVLRGGDRLGTSDGRVVAVVAKTESLLHAECDSPHALARAAYHLGNRHVPVQIGAGWLRIAADHVLERMLVGLGARVSSVEAPFEPEAGAYAAHSHGESGSGARIHEYVAIAGASRDRAARKPGCDPSRKRGQTLRGDEATQADACSRSGLRQGGNQGSLLEPPSCDIAAPSCEKTPGSDAA